MPKFPGAAKNGLIRRGSAAAGTASGIDVTKVVVLAPAPAPRPGPDWARAGKAGASVRAAASTAAPVTTRPAPTR
jgi:hypothetical protein